MQIHRVRKYKNEILVPDILSKHDARDHDTGARWPAKLGESKSASGIGLQKPREAVEKHPQAVDLPEGIATPSFGPFARYGPRSTVSKRPLQPALSLFEWVARETPTISARFACVFTTISSGRYKRNSLTATLR